MCVRQELLQVAALTSRFQGLESIIARQRNPFLPTFPQSRTGTRTVHFVHSSEEVRLLLFLEPPEVRYVPNECPLA